MPLTWVEKVGPVIVRLSCLGCCAVALFTVVIFADIWRIEREHGRHLSAVIIGVLAAALLTLGTLFGRCAVTGCYPDRPGAACP